MKRKLITYAQSIWLNQLGGRSFKDAIKFDDEIGVIMSDRNGIEYFHVIPNDDSIMLVEKFSYTGRVKQVFARLK